MATHGAARKALPVLRDPVIRRRQRVFKCWYQCPICPNEFEDTMLTISSSFCPTCDAEIEPYYTEEWEEETIEIEDSEED